jgi:galactitol-specific phosphotransferase system IIC component
MQPIPYSTEMQNMLGRFATALVIVGTALGTAAAVLAGLRKVHVSHRRADLVFRTASGLSIIPRVKDAGAGKLGS